MKLLKFRQFIDDEFLYWGYCVDADEGSFISPKDPSKPSQQFTGLSDKNGVRIYEGDVIRYRDDYTHPYSESKDFKTDKVGYVAYITDNNIGGRFAVWYRDWEGKLEGYNSWVEPPKTEVIGNIYENPELLEQSQ
jgi:uncharacterized phage protein (TIGR01671 family)